MKRIESVGERENAGGVAGKRVSWTGCLGIKNIHFIVGVARTNQKYHSFATHPSGVFPTGTIGIPSVTRNNPNRPRILGLKVW